MAFTYRVGLGRPLTYQELDDNLQTVENLHDDTLMYRNSAESYSELSQSWAESLTPPAPGAKSSRMWAQDAQGHESSAQGYANAAYGHEQQAQIYAAAAQSAAGLPSLVGNAGKSLLVKGDASGVEWGTPSQTYPGAGIAVSTGSGWDTSKDAPTGDIVGTTDTQTLSNKTLGGGTKEGVLATGTAITINDAAVPWRQTTLTANRTVTVNLSIGVSKSLWVNPATYTLTLPAGTWLHNFPGDGLPASKWSLIAFTGRPGSTAGIAAYIMSEE